MSLTVVAFTMFQMTSFLNGLVLGPASGTAGAANRLHMAMALFGMTIVPSFFSHLENVKLKGLLPAFFAPKFISLIAKNNNKNNNNKKELII